MGRSAPRCSEASRAASCRSRCDRCSSSGEGHRSLTQATRVGAPESGWASESAAGAAERRHEMTLIWFVIWFLADRIGDREPLLLDPVNVWAATLVLALALDVGRAG